MKNLKLNRMKIYCNTIHFKTRARMIMKIMNLSKIKTIKV